MKPMTVLLNLTLRDRSQLKSVLEGIVQGLEIRVLRGRVTGNDASFELELSGPMRRVQAFLRESAKWSATVA